VPDVVDEYVASRPPEPLRAAVPGYTGYRQRGLAPALHRGLPSPYVTVIFTLDEKLDVARHADPNQPPELYESLIGGLHTAPALIRHDGAQSGIQLQVSPLWARRLFGLPAGELADIDVAGEDLLGPAAATVRARLQEARTWPERFAVVDRALAARLAQAPRRSEPPAEIVHAWRRLLRERGRTRIDALAAEAGWSSRHLATRFRTEIGLPPKAAARVIRFDAARRRLQRGGTSIAELAATYGYYDQPHLVREFGALAGCSPTRWLADEFGDRSAED
jgi:AraC-like DNA-binding protein